MSNQSTDSKSLIAQRFRGFLPVVVDIETAGFNSETDAILEIAAATLTIDNDGLLHIGNVYDYQVEPFVGAHLNQASLEFTGIDPDDPARGAQPEKTVLKDLFAALRQHVKEQGCSRAILVGHNAHFDHRFVMAASQRCRLKNNPFHSFSVLDTVTLSALAVGETVLAKACEATGIAFVNDHAHSARYDTIKTAELFCAVANRWRQVVSV